MSSLTTAQKLVIVVIAWLLLSGGSVGSSAPFKTNIFRVVILHDSAKVGSVPAWVNGADESAVRGWVEKHGGEFRLLDPSNDDRTKLSDVWKEAIAVKHESLPWIAGATQRRGISEALPDKREDALNHLAPLGGS